MSSSSRLIDQPTDVFPFNVTTYDRIIDEFDLIESRFRSLQHAGNAEAKLLADMSVRIKSLVYELWDAVVEAEHRERKAERRKKS